MKKGLIGLALLLSVSTASTAQEVLVADPGSPALGWGSPYAIPITVIAGGLIRMYVVGEIEKRCWTENDNQAVLVGPLSSGSMRCYQGPGAVKYKAP